MAEEIKSAFTPAPRKESPKSLNVMKKPKEALGVVIICEMFKIVGDVHLTENTRLSDMLNMDTSKKDFVPVTNARVYSINEDKLLYTKEFMLVNRQYVLTVFVEESSLKQIKEIIKVGHSLISMKQYDDAIVEARRAISINSSDPDAHFMLGIAYAKKSMLSEAYEEFKLSSAFAPKNSEIEHRAIEMMSRIKL